MLRLTGFPASTRLRGPISSCAFYQRFQHLFICLIRCDSYNDCYTIFQIKYELARVYVVTICKPKTDRTYHRNLQNGSRSHEAFLTTCMKILFCTVKPIFLSRNDTEWIYGILFFLQIENYNWIFCLSVICTFREIHTRHWTIIYIRCRRYSVTKPTRKLPGFTLHGLPTSEFMRCTHTSM